MLRWRQQRDSPPSNEVVQKVQTGRNGDRDIYKEHAKITAVRDILQVYRDKIVDFADEVGILSGGLPIVLLVS